LTVVALRTVPPVAASGHVVIQPAGRHSFAALDAKVAQLRRILSGPSTPAAMLPEIDRLAGEIAQEAARVRRFCR
jgi:hypothetical protein